MWDQIVIYNYGKEKYNPKPIEEIVKIWTEVTVYGSYVMLFVLFVETIYFVKIKRWQRFELTILFLMYFKYLLCAFARSYNEA